MKRLRSIVVLATVLSTLILGTTHKQARAMTPPNIVLILTDDQRWDTVGTTQGLNGQPVMPIVTAELVDSGVMFTNAFTTTALCSPSRASLLTGLYAHNHGVLNNGIGMSGFDDSTTVATLLHGVGYRTSLIGKYLNGYIDYSPYIPPGWDDWQVFNEQNAGYFDYDLNENGSIVHYGSSPADYSTDVLAAKATSFITSSAAQGQPFFLYFSVAAPHSPFTPAPRHKGMYAGLADWRPPSYNEPNINDKPLWLRSRPRLNTATQNKIDQWRIDSMESLLAVDEAVGGIMDALRAANVDSNTMVIFTSDHGFMWGEHRLTQKQCPYEECLRVPMVVRYPPLRTAPRQDASLVLNIDIFSTALDLAGVPLPAGTNGASFVTLLSGPAPWRSDFLGEHWPDDAAVPQHALVRNAQYKYVEYLPGSGQACELYDLPADPSELQNRADGLAQTKIDLAARLQALKAE